MNMKQQSPKHQKNDELGRWIGFLRAFGFTALGFALGSFFTGWVRADSELADAKTTAAVGAVKRAIVAAHKAKDRAALDRLYDDDYTSIDSKGTIRTKDDLLKGLPQDPEIVEGKYDLIAVRRFGSIAVASGRGHLVYRNADGTTRVSDYYSFNVFERDDGRWTYVAAFVP